jgi:hypothetical protein
MSTMITESHRRKVTMPKRRLFLIPVVFVIVAVSAYVMVFGRPPKRPDNVPDSAVFVEGAKTGWWQSCWATVQGTTMCRVFSKSGQILVDEQFLPYDGGPSPRASELVLDPKNRYSDVYRVGLKNGRILLRKSMYAQSKELLDSLESTKK